jgi:hypothetical protein
VPEPERPDRESDPGAALDQAQAAYREASHEYSEAQEALGDAEDDLAAAEQAWEARVDDAERAGVRRQEAEDALDDARATADDEGPDTR